MEISTKIKYATTILLILILYGVFHYPITQFVKSKIIAPANDVMLTKRIVSLLFGLLLIFVGSNYFLHPVSYTQRAQYDLRGWLKFFAAFSAIFPGICLVRHAFRANNFQKYECTTCEYEEKLFESKNYKCPLCKSDLIEKNI